MTGAGAGTGRYVVPGLARGLRLLELFDRTRPEWTLAELTTATGLPRSTTYRLAVTLERLGYLDRTEPHRTYRLGVRVLHLGFEFLGSQELVEIAHAPLQRLSARTGGSTHLAILDGADALYLLRVAGPNRLVSNVRAGTRLPAHATVMGRALLAAHDAEALRTRFGDAPLAAATRETATTIEALAAQVRDVLTRGYALSVAGFEAGISSVGAPVWNASSEVVAAINFTGPDSQFDHQRLRTEVVGAVCETAGDLSRSLGWREGSGPERGLRDG